MGFFSSIGKAISGSVGSIIGAGASLLGVNKNSKATSDANAANMAFAREQLEYQKELAKNQIQWKVEDAKKAGLHPLAGLGVSPSSFSPVSGGVVPNTQDYSYLQQMGQDIDRSILQAKTKEEQKNALRLQEQSIALDLRGKDLNNQILEAELASRRARLAQMMGPPNPATAGLSRKKYAIPGQSDARMPDKKGSVPAGDPMYAFQETTEPGVFTMQPGSDWAQLFEDKGMIPELWPLFKTYGIDLAGRMAGKVINGMVYSDSRGGWVKANGPLDDTKTSLRSSRYWLDRFPAFKSKLIRLNHRFNEVSLPRILGRTLFRRSY